MFERFDETGKIQRSSHKPFIIILMLFMLLIVWYEIPVTEHITLKSDKISEPLRIALVTDLHSCSYGKDDAALGSHPKMGLKGSSPSFFLPLLTSLQ